MTGSSGASRRDPPLDLHRRSAIPGRERWRSGAVRGRPEVAAALEAALAARPELSEVRVNPGSGGILVCYPREAPRPPVGPLLRERLEEVLARPPQPAGPVRSAPLVRLLRESLPPRGEIAEPALLSAAGHTLHLLQGLSFVATVNTARGDGPKILRFLGLRRPGPRLAVMTALSLGLVAGDLWLQYLRRKAWKRLGGRVEHRVRTRLLSRIQAQDLEFFDRHGTGELVNLVRDDTARVRRLVEHGGDQVIEKGLTIGVAGGVLLTASPRLALLAALPLPFLSLPARFLGPRVAAAYARVRESSDRFSQALENDLAGIADIKSFTAERRETRRLAERGTRLAEDSLQASAASLLQANLGQGIVSLGFYLTSGYGGRMVAQGKLSSGKYSRVLYVFPQFLSSIAGIGELTQLYHDAVQSASRLTAVMEARPRIRSGPVRLPARTRRGEVIFEGVSFGYEPGKRVVEEVSFHLRPGETLAIVGSTGSGKSTLLRLLLRLYEAEAGRILVDGEDVRRLDLGDLRSAIGLVSQDVYLFQGSVNRNVRYGRPRARRKEVVAALRQAGAGELLETLPDGIEAEVGERGRRLSGGERQRVALARALLKGAPILALDEATSNLDYETESEVLRSLRRATADTSVIMVAHRLPSIRHADRVLVLEGGRVAEEGRHEELIARGGLYASLWALQSEGSAGP